jgi:hypothetical protein
MAEPATFACPHRLHRLAVRFHSVPFAQSSPYAATNESTPRGTIGLAAAHFIKRFTQTSAQKNRSPQSVQPALAVRSVDGHQSRPISILVEKVLDLTFR